MLSDIILPTSLEVKHLSDNEEPTKTIIEKQKIIESIIETNKETIQAVFTELQCLDTEFVCSVIEHGMHIRPKNADIFVSLLELLCKKYSFKPKQENDAYMMTLFEQNKIEYKKEHDTCIKVESKGNEIEYTKEAIEKKYSVDQIYDSAGFLDPFDDGYCGLGEYNTNNPLEYKKFVLYSIENVFKEDNPQKFIEDSAKPSFSFEYVMKDAFVPGIDSVLKTDKLSYMQLIALYGSIKCFKFAVLDNSFSIDNIEKYAIAGGNYEIIHILESKNVSFDHCLEVSLIYHRYELFEWLCQHYKCEDIKLDQTIKWHNCNAFRYMLNKTNAIDHKMIKDAYGLSLQKRNFCIMDYLVKLFDIKISLSGFRYALQSRRLDAIYLYGDICKNIEGLEEMFRNIASSYMKETFNIGLIKPLGEIFHLNFDIFDEERKPLLHKVVESRAFETLDYLVNSCNIDINTKDKYGKTALHIASERSELKTVKHLVESFYADIDEKDAISRTAKDIAVEKDNREIIEYFRGLNENEEIMKRRHIVELYKSIDHGYYDLFFENYKYDVETRGRNGRTILHYALWKGNLDAVKYLIGSQHANINAKDNNNKNALHIAVMSGKLDLIKYLVDTYHFYADEKDNYGKTALDYAASFGYVNIVEYLKNKAMVKRYLE